MTVVRSRMPHHEAIMFDVGHGDCTLIVSDTNESLLVDCGSTAPKRYSSIPAFIERFVTIEKSCGLVVSHYHWDHYSLFSKFMHPEKLFSRVYVPELPMIGPQRVLSTAIYEFLKTALFSDFEHYRILPELIFGTRLPVVTCLKGTSINEANLPFRVFWPDMNSGVLQTNRISEKAKRVSTALESIMNEFDIRKPSEVGVDYSFKTFLNEVKEERIMYRELSEARREKIYQTLEEVEEDFSEVADAFSIAFKTQYKRKGRFLFLGDLSDMILDRIIIPGRGEYDIVKASHHGTRFGKSLENLSTEYVLVSAAKNSKKNNGVSDGYVWGFQKKDLLSTSRLGNCYII